MAEIHQGPARLTFARAAERASFVWGGVGGLCPSGVARARSQQERGGVSSFPAGAELQCVTDLHRGQTGDEAVPLLSSGKRRTTAVLRMCAALNCRCPPLLELEEDDPEVAGDERGSGCVPALLGHSACALFLFLEAWPCPYFSYVNRRAGGRSLNHYTAR
jgi:hypothetical protein